MPRQPRLADQLLLSGWQDDGTPDVGRADGQNAAITVDGRWMRILDNQGHFWCKSNAFNLFAFTKKGAKLERPVQLERIHRSR